jgi:serine protease Do
MISPALNASMRLRALAIFGGLFIVSVCCQSVGGDELEDILQLQESRIKTIMKARAATVAVFSADGRGGGSGVLISPDGYAVTNYHVVKPCGPFMKCGLDDGVVYDAVIVGIDATGDVALIKLQGRDDFPTAKLADSNTVQLGQPCFAIGNPFLLATNLQPTVTWGLVSGVHRYQEPSGTLLEYTDCIQTDASINPGNSGGPLFNTDGDVIGINGRISLEKRGRVNVGVGYAISSNQVKYFLGYLKSGRLVDHATLGATVTSADDNRVIIGEVLQSSDAYRRGLRYDDELVSFGGRRIDTPNGFKNVLGIYPKGWRIPIEYRREGKTFKSSVQLAGLHAKQELIDLVQGAAPRQADPNDPPENQPEGPQQPAPPQAAPDEVAKKDLFPEEVKAQFVARRGYANYFFNKQHQDRLLAPFELEESTDQTSENWKITATETDGTLVEIGLGPEVAAWQSPDDIQLVDFEKDLADQRLPEGSGGLLLAAYHWQRLNVGQARKLGEVTYVGLAPRTHLEQLDDVLAGTLQSVQTLFYFDPTTGLLTRMETFGDLSVDPCVIEFDDYRELEGRQLPFQWRISEGDQAFKTLTIQSYQTAGSSN